MFFLEVGFLSTNVAWGILKLILCYYTDTATY